MPVALAMGMLVSILGTDDMGTLIQIREASQTCVLKLTNGVLKKNVPLADVREAREPNKSSQGKASSPIRLVAGDGATPHAGMTSPKSPPARLANLSVDTSTRSAKGGNQLKVGDAVKARYKKGSKWFPGKITRVRSDGTYDVEYEDGDSESRVESECIDLVSAASSSASSPSRRKEKDERDDCKRVTSPKAPSRLQVGDKVKARYKKGSKWFPGKITRVRSDGTYDVEYEDGDSESRVESECIELAAAKNRKDDDNNDKGKIKSSTSPKHSSVKKPSRLEVGDTVKARYKKGVKWFPGTVTRVHSDGSCDIRYEDGDMENKVDITYIELVSSNKHREDDDKDAYENKSKRTVASPTHKSSTLEKGDAVKARYKKGSKWFSGKITRLRSDGTFDIEYEDGDVETNVASMYIELVPSEKPSKSSSSNEGDGDRGRGSKRSPLPKHKSTKYQVGDVVKARYKNGTKWFPGTIARVHSDGSCDIRYDDGDSETRVDSTSIELVAYAVGNAKSKAPLRVGDAVTARYNKGSKWFSGVISHAHSDGTYDVKYDDGDTEKRVAKELIKPTENDRNADESRSKSPQKSRLQVGDVVTARYNKGSKWFSGTITRARSDDTYDIKYDDGDTETRVALDLIKPKEDANSKFQKQQLLNEFEVGDRVMARLKRSTKLYKGTIVRVRTNGTFDVEFDSGNTETQLDLSMLERVEDERNSKSLSREERLKSPLKKNMRFEVGEEVKVRYKGGAKFFPAKITREQSDGTFDVKYDDGDVETHIDPSLIESTSKKYEDKLKIKSGGYQAGDIVRAKYKNGAKWFRGKITRARSDGTYDIRYDDGDVETHVDERAIQPDDSASDSKEKCRGFKVGQLVNVRYKKGLKWFPGKITKVRSDDTFDVNYDDGDDELRVSADLIESRETHEGKDSKVAKGDVSEDSKLASRLEGDYDKYCNTHSVKKVVDSDASDSECGRRHESKKRKKRHKYEHSSLDSASDGEHSLIEKGARVMFRKAKDEKSRRIGVIKRVHSDRSCDLEYVDGSKVKRIAAKLLMVCSASEGSDSSEGTASRSKQKKDSKTVKGQAFHRNDKVISSWRRASKFSKPKATSKWEEAVVLARHSDNTYSIRYDRGDVEEDVPSDALKAFPMKHYGHSSDSDDRGKQVKRLRNSDGVKQESIFLLEQLAVTLFEEGIMKRKPKLSLLRTNEDSSSESSSSHSNSSSSAKSSKSSKHSLSSEKSKIDSILARLFEPALIKTYRRAFAEQGSGKEGKLSRRKIVSLVEALCESKKKPLVSAVDDFTISRVLTDWFDSDDELRRHRKFEFKTLMLAFAFAKHRQSKFRVEQRVATVLEGRFASHHENKRQLELWQQKLGFRTFETLQRFFHDRALPNIIPARIPVTEVGNIFDQVARNAAPNKPLELYLQQLHLQLHNTLLLPEFLCCYYQLYGSSDNRTTIHDALELRPVAFVASCLFSNGDIVCMRHGDLVRRLSVGRTPGQQELILRFREVFESLQPAESESDDLAISTSQLATFAAKIVHDPTILESALAALRKRAATVSLVEVYAACGFVIDELTAAPTISNAIEKLKLRVEVAEVRRIVTLVRNMCLKILRFPNNSDYWRIRADSDAFQQKIGRFDGATNLLEAVGFVEYSRTHFELRGARMADGKRVSTLSKTTLNKLRDKCVELDAELSLFDGVESISSILQRISKERERETPLTLDECQEVLNNMSTYIENILKNPKDSRCWRIREANKTFQRQIGYLPFATDLMESIGYELVQTSQGNVFALRGTGTLTQADPTKQQSVGAKGAQASLSNFAFSRVSEQMEWFLWRRKQEIDTLFEDEMHYLMDAVRARSTSLRAESSLANLDSPQLMTSKDAGLVKMYPYGKNAIDTFNKTPVQRKQIEMISTVFNAIDLEKRGFLIEQDFARIETDPNAPLWMRFDAFDIDKDGKIDLVDFVAALGPLLDHSYDIIPSRHHGAYDITDDKLTLCEQVSLAVGRVRVGVSLLEASAGFNALLLLLHKIIQEPSNQELWFIREKNDLSFKLLRFQAGRELVRLCGFRELTDSISKLSGEAPRDEIKFALQPQKLRFKTSKTAAEPDQALDSGTIARLQTVIAMLSGHCRGLKYPEISDVGAVSRTIGLMPDLARWIPLTELSLLCIANILKHPDDDRYRKLKTSTQTYSKVVGSLRGGSEFMLSLGFREVDDGALVLPLDVSTKILAARKLELEVGLQALKAVRSNGQDHSVVLGSPRSPARGPKTNIDGSELDYYKKKALAAELARQQEIKKSQHLAKQLELLADARFGPNKQEPRKEKNPISNQRSRQRPRSESNRARHNIHKPSSWVNDDNAIEKEILSGLSPRASNANDSTASLARGGMDVDAGSDEIYFMDNSVIQSGVVLRVGAELADLVEERVVVSVVTNEAFAGLVKVQLSSSLRFFHPAKELVFIVTLQRQDRTLALEMGKLEIFVRNELLDPIITTAVNESESYATLPYSVTSAVAADTAFSYARIRSLPFSSSCSNKIVLVDPRSRFVLTSCSDEKSSVANGCQVQLARDQATDYKLQAWWEGILMDYGISNTRARLGGVKFAVTQNAYLSLLASLNNTGAVPSLWDEDDDFSVGYPDLLTAFGLSCLLPSDQDHNEVDASLLLLLTYFRKHFRDLSKNSVAARDGFKCVSVEGLIVRLGTDLTANPPRVSEDPSENQEELRCIQALCQAVRKAFRQDRFDVVSWPELQYFVIHRTHIHMPETLPKENELDYLAEHTEIGRHANEAHENTTAISVAQVIVASEPSRAIVLSFDGHVGVWTTDSPPKRILRSFVMIPLKSQHTPQPISTEPDHRSFVTDWINETLICAANSTRRHQHTQRASAALHHFKRSCGDHASLLVLSCWDSILVVNTSFLDNGRCSGRSSLRCFQLTSAQLNPVHQIIIEPFVVRREYDEGNNHAKSTTKNKVESAGTISTFALAPDATSIVFVVEAQPLMVWVADVTSGDVLGYVDAFLGSTPSPSTKLLIQILNNEEASRNVNPWRMCVVSNSIEHRAGGLWEIPTRKVKTMTRQASFSQEKCSTHLQASPVISLASSSGTIMVAKQDGSLTMWSTHSLLPSSRGVSLNPEVSMKITKKGEKLLSIQCTDVAAMTARACEENVSKIYLTSEASTEIEEWEASLGSGTTRLVFYVFEDGEVVSVPVEVFDARMALLGDAAFEYCFYLEPPPSRSDHEKTYSRVALQKQQLVRIGFFACQHRQHGVFTLKSMNEILHDLSSQRILWKAQRDFDEFAKMYDESVVMDLKMLYRCEDSKDHEISPQQCAQDYGHLNTSNNAYNKLLFAVVKIEDTQQIQLQVWAVAKEELQATDTQLRLEEFDPNAKTIRLTNACDAVRLKSSYALEAVRFQRDLRNHEADCSMQHLVQQHEYLIGKIKTRLMEICWEQGRNIEVITDELLQSVRLLNLLAVTEQGEYRPLERFFRLMFLSLIPERNESHHHEQEEKVDISVVLSSLQHGRWNTNPFFQPWIQSFYRAMKIFDTKGHSTLTWSKIQLCLRNLQCTWMSFDMVVSLCAELDCVGESQSWWWGPETSEFAALVAQQLLAFFSKTKSKSNLPSLLDALFSSQEVVEFLVEKHNFPQLFDQALGDFEDRVLEMRRESLTDGGIVATDEKYALILASSQWTRRIHRAQLQQLQLSSLDEENTKILTPTVASNQRLKQLLKTLLPVGDVVVASILLKEPCGLARVRCRTFFDAQGRRGNRGPDDAVALSIVLVSLGAGVDGRRRLQQELTFYRKIQRWRAREFFLPVYFSAMDAPIFDQWGQNVCNTDACGMDDDEAAIVTESLGLCVSLMTCITHMQIPGLSLRYWAPIVVFWCRQVLLAAIAMKNEGFWMRNVELISLLVTCDGHELRFASLDAGQFVDREQCDDGSMHVEAIGEFVLKLIGAFHSEGKEMTTGSSCESFNTRQFEKRDGEENEHLRAKRKILLRYLHAERNDKDEPIARISLTELSRTQEVITASSSNINEDILKVYIAGFLALQERSSHLCLESLFEAVFSDTPDHILDPLAHEMSTLVWFQHTLQENILGGLQYCKQSEGDVAVFFGSLVATWTDFLTRLFKLRTTEPVSSQGNAVNAQILQHMEQVVVNAHVTWLFVDAGLTIFETVLAAQEDGSNGHKVVQHVLVLLAFSFQLCNKSRAEELRKDSFQCRLLYEALAGLCRLSSSGSAIAKNFGRSTQQLYSVKQLLSPALLSVFWRLSETLWRDLLGQNAPSQYPNLLAFLKSYAAPSTAEEGDMLDIGYEVPEKTVGLWWSDHGHTLPRLEQSAVVAVRDYEELCILSFEYLDSFHRTLEVYFNLTSSITVPKFRLATLHQWFGASFLERKAFFPMVVVQSMVARVWKDLNFEEILCDLLLDRDENVVLGAVSLMECATRVFRYDGFENCSGGSESNPSSVYMKRPELHRFHSNAITFAKSLCSFRVISRITHTLDRVARLLKVAGGGRKDSPHALTSILCVILSFLTNCLHGGDSATQHWVHTDLIKILLSHAKANALVFVNVVDSNVLNTISFQQQRQRLVTHRDEQHATWKVFTTTTNSTGVSPFKLLLVEVVARAVHSNVLVVQTLYRSPFFRHEVSSIAAGSLQLTNSSVVQQTDLICSREYGKIGHAWELASDLRRYNGTVSEIVQLVAYTKALFVLQRATHPTERLPRDFVRVFIEIWAWMDTTWQELIRGPVGSTDLLRMHGKLVLTSMALMYQLALDPTATAEELAEWTAFSLPSLSHNEQDGSNMFQQIMSLVHATWSAWRAMEASGTSAAEAKFVLSLVATSAVELFVNATRTRKFDTVAAFILERCVDPSTILELLGREACVSTPHLASSGFGVMDKQRLWTSMLHLDSRALTQRIVVEGFLDHSVVAALHDPSLLKQHSHAEIEDVRQGSRLEALMFLEVLVKLSAVLCQSVNVQLLFTEVSKLVLLHQTISKEATLVRESQRTAAGGRQRAIAKRVLQVICCVCVDFRAQRVDRVFQERLEAIGIPLWVIHFHQSYPNASSSSDATQQYDQAHLFWKDWSAQLRGSATKKPKSTLSQSMGITVPRRVGTFHLASPPGSKVATTAMKYGAPEREERRPIVHFSDQPRQTALVTKTTSRRECGTKGNETMDEPAHRASLAANEARKKPMDRCTAIHLAPELAIVSPVKTHSTTTPTGRFSTNNQSKAPEKPAPDLVQTLMSIDFESAQILSRQTTPTAAAGAAVKESKQKKEKSNFVRDDDSESLGSDAYSPFPAASSLSSSSSASSRGSDKRSRSRMKVRDAKAKRKQMHRRRDSREAKGDGRDEAKQHDTSSSRGSSSDGSETRRRGCGKKEPHRHNASRSSSFSEVASSGSSTAEAPRRTRMRKSSHAASATDHAKEMPDPHVETLRRVFHKYDVDGDGAISFIDLRKALNNAQTQQRLTDVEIQKWITEKDRSGQGVVGFEDFCVTFGLNAARSQRIATAEADGVAKPPNELPQWSKRLSNKPKSTMSTCSQVHEPKVRNPRAPTRADQGHRLGYTQEPATTPEPPPAAVVTAKERPE